MRTIFFFLMFASLSGAAPMVFRVSDPVSPGETALLFGDGIGKQVTAEGWRMPDSGAAPAPVALRVLQAGDTSAKVLLPGDWKPGVFAIRLKNASGSSPVILLNRPDAWWYLAGPRDQAFPGEELRVFGKNFGSQTTAYLSTGQTRIPIATKKAEKYCATFQLPASLAAGKYQLHLTSGYGGNQGYAPELTVQVSKRDVWPSATFNVKEAGAAGNGIKDDTESFRTAFQKAQANGGGVVYAPRGIYKITGRLAIPPKTVLRGEKREWVWLTVPKDTPEFDTVLAGNGDFAVEELSIVSQTARRLIVCPDRESVFKGDWGTAPPPDQQGHNVRLHRLRLQHLRFAHRVQKDDPRRMIAVGPSTVVLAGPDMELSESEIVSSGMPLVAINGRHNRIQGNRLDTGRNGWYGLWTAEESVFEDNTIQARDLEGSYGGVQGRAYRLYFAHNNWRDAYGDEREALTFDTPYEPYWMGRAAASGATLNAEAPGWKSHAFKNAACLIVFGKGLGQFIPIVDNTETSITLTHPWVIPPDATSHIAVIANKSDVVITENNFADASVSVQLYAMTYGFLIDGNHSVRTGGSYAIGRDATVRDRRRFSCAMFHQWLGNEFSEGFVYEQGAFAKGVLGPTGTGGTLDPPAIPMIGNIVRNNKVRDNFTIGAMYFNSTHPKTAPPSSAGAFGIDTIIEGNSISDSPVAIEVYPRYSGTLIRNNKVVRCEVPLNDSGTDTWIDPAGKAAYGLK